MPDQPYVTPTPTGRVVNAYGGTQHRAPGHTGKLPATNVGVDYAAKMGDPAVSPVDGVVIEVVHTKHDDTKGQRDVMENGGYGGYILVKGDDGSVHRLSHAMYGSIRVKAGDRVKQNQQTHQVGASGNTSDGKGGMFPHVDHEYRTAQGQYADPAPLSRRSTMPDVPEDVARRQDAAKAQQGQQPAKAEAPADTLGKLRQQEQDLRALIGRYEKAAPDTQDSFEASNKLPGLYQQLGGVLTQIGQEENRQRDDAKPKYVVVEGAVYSQQPDGSLKLEKDKTPEDPSVVAARGKQADAAVTSANASATNAATNAAVAPSQIAQNQASANQANASAARIAALTPAELAKMLADAGLTKAQADAITAKLGPELERIKAETAQAGASTELAKAQTDRIRALLEGEITRQKSETGLTDAQAEKIRGMLPLEQAQAQAQTGLTTATTGKVTAETRLAELQGKRIEIQDTAWATFVQPLLDANAPPDQIKAAVARALTSVDEQLKYWANQNAENQLAETARNNREQEATARTNARTNQQNAANNAMESYGRFGLATAPWQSNLLSAMAPVTDFMKVAQGMGMDPDGPVVQGVKSAWDQYTASQQQHRQGTPAPGMPGAPGAGAPPAAVPGQASPAPAPAPALVPQTGSIGAAPAPQRTLAPTPTPPDGGTMPARTGSGFYEDGGPDRDPGMTRDGLPGTTPDPAAGDPGIYRDGAEVAGAFARAAKQAVAGKEAEDLVNEGRPGWARTTYTDGTSEEWQIPGGGGGGGSPFAAAAMRLRRLQLATA